MQRVRWPWSCTARGWSTRSRPPTTPTSGPARTCCWRCSPPSRRPGPRVGSGRRRPRHPGARRLRLHPRLPRRAVLPGQPAQPDPRGHPGHPGPGPARPQGGHAGRSRAGAARRDDRRHHGPGGRHRMGTVRRRPRRRGRPAGQGHDDAVGRRRRGRHAGQRARLPRGGGTHRRGWLWLEQALATRASDSDFHEGEARGRPVLLPAGSCRRCTCSSTCSSRWTGQCWTRPRPTSDPDDDTSERDSAPPPPEEGAGARCRSCSGQAVAAPTGSATVLRPAGRSARCSRS